MTRLFVIAEGATEARFVGDILAPHLGQRLVLHRPPMLDGNYTYAKLKKLVLTLLGDRSAEVRVTTMIDLFKLPGDFPGRAECNRYKDPRKGVAKLEVCFSTDIGDHRLLPYLQLHEFEALILTDVRCLAEYYPNRKRALSKLASDLEKQFPSPEQVDRLWPPSRRIKEVVPDYQKPLFGIEAVKDLGLQRIRERCPHFHAWLQTIEAL